MAERWPDRDPADSFEYAIGGWREHIKMELGSDGSDYVVSATWTATPPDYVLGAAEVSPDGDVTAVRIQNTGRPGIEYKVKCRALTANGDTVNRSALQFCRDR